MQLMDQMKDIALKQVNPYYLNLISGAGNAVQFQVGNDLSVFAYILQQSAINMMIYCLHLLLQPNSSYRSNRRAAELNTGQISEWPSIQIPSCAQWSLTAEYECKAVAQYQVKAPIKIIGYSGHYDIFAREVGRDQQH